MMAQANADIRVMPPEPAPLVGELQAALLGARSADGGWPYYSGKAGRLEPTCWAVLALGGHPAATSAVDALCRWPTRDRLLVEGPSGEVNVAFNGLAAIALTSAGGRARSTGDALVTELIAVKGLKLRNHEALGQDNTLQGWPWRDRTFSFVEPTAWCLLALKRHRAAGANGRALEARIDEAERLLRDRVCRGGGWNYGSPLILGQALAAHVPTTALALLALQDGVGESAIAESLAFLGAACLSEPSALALALASLALRACGRSADAVDRQLEARLPASAPGRSLTAIAMAMCALQGEAGVAALRV